MSISLMIFIFWAVWVVIYLMMLAAEEKTYTRISGYIALVFTVLMAILTISQKWGTF